MKIDAALAFRHLSEVPAVAQAAEEIGFDGLWSSETQHNPFLPLTLAAEHSSRLELGTAIAVAFARSPMELAYTAWDLADLAQGRFILGLGTQVKAHIQRRFSMPWEAPARRLREFILALRAIWDCWQNGTKLNFRGEFYTMTLMTPFFNPGPIEHPDIPIYIAGVNRHLCRVAGELCQGFHVHPLNSARDLRERIIPYIEEGLRMSGRTRADIQLSTAMFVITGETEAEMDQAREEVRAQIAFYASTPTYRPVLETHGWGATGEQLSRLASRGRWDEMPALITDEMLDAFAVTAPWDELPRQVVERYRGLLDRVTYYVPFRADLDVERWKAQVEAFREATG